MNLDFISIVEFSFISICVFKSNGIFLLYRNNSVVIVLAFILDVIKWINFQKTWSVKTVNHFILAFIVFDFSLRIRT